MTKTPMDWVKFFNDPSMVMILVGGIIALIVLIKWHRDDNSFNLRDLFIDPKTGKVSVSQMGVLTALVVSTWGFVAQIQDNNMTEFYFLGYMAGWAGYRAIIKNLDSKERRETDK